MATQLELPDIPAVDRSQPAMVVLSGGQDSVTCLGLALHRHDKVYACSFHYGQKHKVELFQARTIADRMKVPHSVIDLAFLASLVTSELMNPDGDFSQGHAYKPGLPASFVPTRNALFLTLAHAQAQETRCGYIYTGVCQTDYSGYPDCREEFIRALEHALNVGYQTDIKIITPMMFLDKAETFQLADDVGCLQTVLEDSHTCYHGDRSMRHDWGYGCGECPACVLRVNGYYEFTARRADADGQHEYAQMMRKMKNNAEPQKLLREASKAPKGRSPTGNYKPRGFA